MAEIKISELSIGDWVRYRDREWIVCSLYQFTEEVGLWRKDSQLCEYVADIKPIPITPEILEKNGFEEFKDKSWVGHNHHCHIQPHGSSWTLLANKRGFYRTICFESLEFVHELQHALRLAGVEKEIEV